MLDCPHKNSQGKRPNHEFCRLIVNTKEKLWTYINSFSETFQMSFQLANKRNELVSSEKDRVKSRNLLNNQ